MKTRIWFERGVLVSLLLAGAAAVAQVPVDDDGRPLGSAAAESDAYGEDIPQLTEAELAELVAPIALYPDDLLAVVLPAATYPLQVVEAGRFLDALDDDPSLEPDPDWDDSVVALVNYPEIVELMNDDLDWTWQLGEAVISQQAGVIAAVESFRDRAYAAGNLRSDEFQRVSRDEGIIEIEPVNDDVIYVPYYEPERVVVYQPTPVYHYYPAPRPVYYYPYPTSYAFDRGYFWGVTTAFTIGWATDRVRVYHVSYDGHPYYGHYYHDRWWYRRPSISVHRSIYIDNSVHVSARYRSRGDYWRPSRHTRLRYSDQRISRSHYIQDRRPRVRRTTVHRSYDSRDRTRFAPGSRAPKRYTTRPNVRDHRDGASRSDRARVRTRPDRERDIMRDQRHSAAPRPRDERRRSAPNYRKDPRKAAPERLAANDRLRTSDRRDRADLARERTKPAQASGRGERRNADRQRNAERGNRRSERQAPKAARADRAPRSDRRRERGNRSNRRNADRKPR